VQDIPVRDPEHHDAALPEERVAKAVTSLAAVVRRAVDLDCELDGNAEEVGEVRTNRKLASEPEAVELATA